MLCWAAGGRAEGWEVLVERKGERGLDKRGCPPPYSASRVEREPPPRQRHPPARHRLPDTPSRSSLSSLYAPRRRSGSDMAGSKGRTAGVEAK